MPQGMFWQIAAASFGIAAAVLLILGWVILRFQRDRQHFALMQTALERGITALPGAVPGWVVSLRQGVLALVLGLGVLAAGFTLRATASMIDPVPDQPRLSAGALGAPAAPAAAPDDEDLPPDQRPPPPGMGRPQQGPPRARPPAPRDAPPRPTPAMDRWHRIEAQSLAGLVAICAGGILALLGVVRIAFSRIERKYSLDLLSNTPAPARPPAAPPGAA